MEREYAKEFVREIFDCYGPGAMINHRGRPLSTVDVTGQRFIGCYPALSILHWRTTAQGQTQSYLSPPNGKLAPVLKGASLAVLTTLQPPYLV